MTKFSFTKQSRNPRTVLNLICIYAVLIALKIMLDAAWWLMVFFALVPLPALWDVINDTSADIELSQDTLRWHTGQRLGELKLSEVDRFRFDTQWNFSVRVSAMLCSEKRVRLPDESLPPHRQFEEVLRQADFTVERNHFRVF